MLDLLETDVYGNEVVSWGLAASIAVIVLGTSLLAKWLLLSRLPEARPGHDLHWRELLRDLAQRTSALFLVIAALYAGALVLALPAPAARLVFSIFVIALFIQGAVWADRIVTALLGWQLAPRRSKPAVRNALSLIEVLARVGIWAFAALLIFENLGFNVTALVAGLGIGGIAVALAAQRVLGDLFASLAIVLDRPFEVGDVIVFGDQSGTVEKIGVKTTRIRSVSGEQIVCANSDLVNSRIHNFKRMAERRVLFSLAVPYATQPDKLERIPVLLKEIIEAQEPTRFERAHFKGFGESALTFEIVYWVLTPNEDVAMDIQQAIMLAILRSFEQEGIEFAYPTRTLNVPEIREMLSAQPATEPPRLHASGPHGR